jgi:phosphoribosylaminoimidazolecarboxamide formyltransferase/IMP cyclohydrolase
MMDGRVKTLHPSIHGGILARRDHPEDLEAAGRHGIGLVDLVAVNLYPFVQTAARPGTAFHDLVEQIDIGGPSLVRAAAKTFRDVLVVVSPGDYSDVLGELDLDGGPSPAFRFELARRAFAHTGSYDVAIAATLAEVTALKGSFSREPAAAPLAPNHLLIDGRKVRDLRYGENPHQPAAWYALDPVAGLGAPDILQGKELSFTNLLDLDAAARIVLEFEEPAAAVIKHTNPCGAATGATQPAGRRRHRAGDRLDLHRGGGGSGSGRCGATHPGDEGESARGGGSVRSARRSRRRGRAPARGSLGARRAAGPGARSGGGGAGAVAIGRPARGHQA